MNYLAIIVCAVLSLIMGSIWYGPLFGKLWMRLCGMDQMTDEQRKEAQKAAMPLYLLQFVLSLVQIWVLATYTVSFQGSASMSVMNAVWIWLGFVMPTVAGACMWTGESRGNAWKRFFVTAGFQLVCFIVFGFVLGTWM